jgi:hypothetical protein
MSMFGKKQHRSKQAQSAAANQKVKPTTSDAIPLTSLADAYCLVIQQGVSTRAAVSQALEEIKHVNTVGVVLNRVDVRTPPWLLNYIPHG